MQITNSLCMYYVCIVPMDGDVLVPSVDDLDIDCVAFASGDSGSRI